MRLTSDRAMRRSLPEPPTVIASLSTLTTSRKAFPAFRITSSTAHVAPTAVHLVAYVQHMPGNPGKQMNVERHVRLFRNGRNQALRIPRDLELPGRAATLRKEGTRLIVEPVAAPSLLSVLAELKPLDEGLPPVLRPAAEPIEL
jgi:antitoxin VapB